MGCEDCLEVSLFIGQGESFSDLLTVAGDGCGREAEEGGDLFGGMALLNQIGNLNLSRSKFCEQIVLIAGKGRGDFIKV